MRTTLLIIIGLSINPFCYAEAINNNNESYQLYVSIDSNGNKVFTDKPPLNSNYQVKAQTLIKTVQWQNSAEIKNIKVKTRKSKKSSKKSNHQFIKKKQCTQFTNKINTIQKQLKRKQKANSFDSLKHRLRELRWQYRKSCI